MNDQLNNMFKAFMLASADFKIGIIGNI